MPYALKPNEDGDVDVYDVDVDIDIGVDVDVNVDGVILYVLCLTSRCARYGSRDNSASKVAIHFTFL